MTSIQRVRTGAIVAALLALAAPARAERWVQAPGAFEPGYEVCVDADSIHPGPDGKTDYLQKICPFDSGLPTRVDCRQDFSGKAVVYEVKLDGAYEREVVPSEAGAVKGIRWACAHR